MKKKKFNIFLLLGILLLNFIFIPKSVFASNNFSNSQDIINTLDKTGDSIYCQDKSNIFSEDTHEYINKYSKDLYDNTKDQIVIVTIDNLNGSSIEDIAIDFNK